MIEQGYRLNIVPDKVLPLVKVSQYDTARVIRFYLYNEDEVYTPSGSIKVLIGTTQFDAMIDGDSVYFTVPSSLTQTAQRLFGEVVIGSTLATLNFIFEVDSTPIGD